MNLKTQKIVITGAPSSGKSSALNQINRVLGNKVVIVPESAVVLLTGGFPAPRHDDLEQIKFFQKAVIQVQLGLEMVFAKQNSDTGWMIFDRGILDGCGFWPPGVDAFFEEFNMDPKKEFTRYHVVLFFELPQKKDFGGINNRRFHNYEQSLESEKRLREVWSKHPHFIEIKATDVFEDKILSAVSTVEKIINN